MHFKHRRIPGCLCIRYCFIRLYDNIAELSILNFLFKSISSFQQGLQRRGNWTVINQTCQNNDSASLISQRVHIIMHSAGIAALTDGAALQNPIFFSTALTSLRRYHRPQRLWGTHHRGYQSYRSFFGCRSGSKPLIHVNTPSKEELRSTFFYHRNIYNTISKEKSPDLSIEALCSRYLFSRPVTRQLSSAYMCLTSVFGMGTGGPT